MNESVPSGQDEKPAASATEVRRTNELAWDLRSSVHAASTFYALDNVAAGSCSLRPVELRLVGDVVGRRLLHLQCHLGTDTVGWARRGAAVTGVDLSSRSLRYARDLAVRAGLDISFVHADVQDLPAELSARFDVVVTTYGVLCWLTDLDAWASGIHRALVPGGRLVLVEFHPTLEARAPGSVSGVGGYFPDPTTRPQYSTGTYTDPAAPISYQEFRHQHPVSHVVTALARAGLRITAAEEHPFCAYPLFGCTVETVDGWTEPTEPRRWPVMYSVTAERTAL